MIEHLYHSLLPSITHFHTLGYWIAFFAAFVETALVVGLLFPGSTLLLLLGALAATGGLDFSGVLWFGVAGAIVGDNLNYWLGSRYGRRWIREGVWFLKPEHFEQARRFIDANGAKSVFLSRFIPSIKEVAPFIAGTVGMRQRTFFFWNVLGGIGWGLQWIGGGYLFGQSLKLAQAWMSRAGMALLALLLAWLLLWLLKRAVMRHGPQTMLVMRSLARSVARAIRGNPFVHHFIRHHPRIMQFLAARTDHSHFCGLPLTLLTLAFFYVLALFAGIVEDLVRADSIVAIDEITAQLVSSFRAPELIQPFIWLTNLGVPQVIGPLLVIAALAFWLLGRRWLIAPLLVSSLGAAAFTMLGKLAFQRPRPAEAVILEHSFSFPSGHATIAVAFYGFLGYVLIRSANNRRNRVNWLFLSGTVILLIGLSRIVLGVHYLSDVWAGYLVGALWLIIGISLNEWLIATGRQAKPEQVKPTRRWAVAGLATLAFAWYLGFAISWQPPRHTPPVQQAIEIIHPVSDYLTDGHHAYTETLLGEPEQPLGFALVAEDEHALLSSLRSAGWHLADRANLQNMQRLITKGMDYTTAPLTPGFWNGHINDFALTMPIQHKDGQALLTLRLWRTPYRIAGKPLFVGVTRAYVGITWGLLHHISPDVDAATEQLAGSLKNSGQLKRSCRLPLVDSMIGTYLMGDRFFTRGEFWLIDLSKSADITPACGPRKPAP